MSPTRNMILTHINTILTVNNGRLPAPNFERVQTLFNQILPEGKEQDSLVAGWLIGFKEAKLDGLRLTPRGLDAMIAIMLCYRHYIAINIGVDQALVLKVIEQDLDDLLGYVYTRQRQGDDILRAVAYNTKMKSLDSEIMTAVFNTAYSGQYGKHLIAVPYATVDTEYKRRFKYTKAFVETYYTALQSDMGLIPAIIHAVHVVGPDCITWVRR